MVVAFHGISTCLEKKKCVMFSFNADFKVDFNSPFQRTGDVQCQI